MCQRTRAVVEIAEDLQASARHKSKRRGLDLTLGSNKKFQTVVSGEMASLRLWIQIGHSRAPTCDGEMAEPWGRFLYQPEWRVFTRNEAFIMRSTRWQLLIQMPSCSSV